MSDADISPMRAADGRRVAAIFAEGIATGDSTFETEVPTWGRWDAVHRSDLRLVGRLDGSIAGWAAAAPVSDREAYRGVAECSVYVAHDARGSGLGEDLLRALIDRSEEVGVWTLEAVVLVDNPASRAMVAACGFRLVGRRERIARIGDRWRDVWLMERRRAG